jgi:hypothetical protein
MFFSRCRSCFVRISKSTLPLETVNRQFKNGMANQFNFYEQPGMPISMLRKLKLLQKIYNATPLIKMITKKILEKHNEFVTIMTGRLNSIYMTKSYRKNIG